MIMANWLGIDRLFSATSRKALNTWVDPHISPASAADLHLNPQQPIVYVLQSPSFSNLLVADEAAQRLGLPRFTHAVDSYLISEKQSYFFLTQETSAQSVQKNRFEYPERFVRLVEAVKKNATLDVQLVPVTIFWGRSPDKEDSLFKVLFSDSWATPNTLKQLVTVALNGHQTFVKFGLPLSIRELMHDDMSSSLALHKISRVLRVHFRRQREMAIGPDLSHRRNLMHSILQSQAVREAIKLESSEQQMSSELLEEKARAYVNEIAADYSYHVLRGFQISLTWLWNRLYDGIDVHHFDTVTQVAQDHEVIYVPCHRSHIDYLLLSYVVFTKGLMPPHVAAGANLNMPIVGSVLRRAGAFFLKRSFKGNRLYSAVFTEYLHLMTTKGFPIEYFIEGGRSRTGRLLPPKTGMLAMTVKSYLRDHTRPIVFIPTYIGYERLMEGSTYVGELRGAAKEQESIWQIVQTTRKIEKIFGKVHLSFGEPIYLSPLLDKENPQWRNTVLDPAVKLPWLNRSVDKLANTINTHINQTAVINPITLLSLALLSTPNHAIDEDVLVKQLDLYKNLASKVPYHQRIEMTHLTGEQMIAYGVQLKAICCVNHPLGDLICVADNQAILLTYFRNNVLHLFVMPSLVACLMQHNGQLQRSQIVQVIASLYPYLKSELFLTWPEDAIEALVNQHIDALIETGILTNHDNLIFAPHPNTEEYAQLVILGEAVKETLERYYMTTSLLTERQSGSMSQKQLEDLCSLLAQRLSVLYEFNSPEFFDKAIFRNFIDTLKKVGLLQTDENNLLHFDHRLNEIATQANLVLRVETQHTIAQITNVSDEEIAAAMAILEKKDKKRK